MRSLRPGVRPGFSLVEMLISLSVGGLVVAALFGTLVNMQRQYRGQRDSRRAEDGMRAAEQVLRTALQGAAADPLGSGLTSLDPGTLTNGKFTTIRIRSDFHPADGNIDGELEDISVKVESDTLLVRWTAAGSWQALAYPVRAVTFEYFDQGLNPLTTAATAPGAVAVRFTVSAPENPKSTTLRSRQTWVYLQNRR